MHRQTRTHQRRVRELVYYSALALALAHAASRAEMAPLSRTTNLLVDCMPGHAVSRIQDHDTVRECIVYLYTVTILLNAIELILFAFVSTSASDDIIRTRVRNVVGAYVVTMMAAHYPQSDVMAAPLYALYTVYEHLFVRHSSDFTDRDMVALALILTLSRIFCAFGVKPASERVANVETNANVDVDIDAIDASVVPPAQTVRANVAPPAQTVHVNDAPPAATVHANDAPHDACTLSHHTGGFTHARA